MPNSNLNPPLAYSLLWLWIGLGLLACIALWYGAVIWFTRRRPIRTIADLSQLANRHDLQAIKAKYLALINQCYATYQRGETDLRGLHRSLSMTVRYFVYEVHHIPAPNLTLTDLRRTPYRQLTMLLNQYYPEEFAAVGKATPEAAVAAAQEMVQQWR